MSPPILSVNQQGQGVVSADELNTFVLGGASLALLQGFTGVTGMTVYLTGYVTPGDGGQGTFYWNASATPPGDNVNLIVPSGSQLGGWMRLGFDTTVSYAAYSYQTPATGFSITIPAGVGILILNPSGTLATGTVTLPASPTDGQEARFSSTQIITTLTVSPSAGASIFNAPATLAAGGVVHYKYVASVSSWFRA